MKIIFSRKGFDSASGGKPSPIFADGRMVSLSIPDKQSPIRYGDIRWQEYNLGSLAYDLTKGRISPSHRAHLDPDINKESLPRQPEWRPILGQTGAAQGHLQKNGVQAGDVFLFFGLFRHVIETAGKIVWDENSPPRHILWGWLQIDEALKVDDCNLSRYDWAGYHPHFHRGSDKSNTVYIARRRLTLPGESPERLAGAGVFPRVSEQLVLTDPDSTGCSCWRLPRWFYPRNRKSPLTYHPKLTLWQRTGKGVRLRAASRGQEFILDTERYPEAIEWLTQLLRNAK